MIAALLAILALVAIACGDSDTATPPPTATPAPAPTVTPTPAPTPPQLTPDSGMLAATGLDELQRYLDAVGPAFQQARLDREAVVREMPNPALSVKVNDITAWFERVRDLRQRLLHAVKDVEPPSGLTSNHDEFVLATSEWVASSDRVLDLLANAGPEFNVASDLAYHPELGLAPANGLSMRVIASCDSIERLAVDKGIDVDLSC